jgi:uncharacterized protein YndB with AHSA1/START domain
MKRLIYALLTIIVVVVLASGILWFLGGQEFPVDAEITVKAPPEKVFAYLTEPEKLKLWITGFADSKPLDNGGLRVGAKAIEIIREENGHTTEFFSEVTKLEINRQIELEMTSDFLDTKIAYSLEKNGEETVIRHQFRGYFKGFLRVMAPFAQGFAKETINKDLNKLKELVEKS